METRKKSHGKEKYQSTDITKIRIKTGWPLPISSKNICRQVILQKYE